MLDSILAAPTPARQRADVLKDRREELIAKSDALYIQGFRLQDEAESLLFQAEMLRREEMYALAEAGGMEATAQ